MKTYPYNRTSVEGRRLFNLFDSQYNPGQLDARQTKSFKAYEVPAVLQCRTNKVRLLLASNLSGLKRPQIHIEADVEQAWGDVAPGITTLDFTPGGEELPLTYVQPLEDDTLKLLIDAGMYRDERFEDLLSKLMVNEVFDADADLNVLYLNVGDDAKQEHVPVIMVDPVDVVHDKHDPSEHTSIQNLVKRSARLAIELRKEGVRTEELVKDDTRDRDREVVMTPFEDVVALADVQATQNEQGFRVASELLDQEIDVTDQLKGSLGFDFTSEDDRIRHLKERERYTESSAVAELEPDDTFLDDEPEFVDEVHAEPEDVDVKLDVNEQTLSAEQFTSSLDDYDFEDEDDGPEL